MKKNKELIENCMYGVEYTVNNIRELQGINTFDRLSKITKRLRISMRKHQDPSYVPPKEEMVEVSLHSEIIQPENSATEERHEEDIAATTVAETKVADEVTATPSPSPSETSEEKTETKEDKTTEEAPETPLAERKEETPAEGSVEAIEKKKDAGEAKETEEEKTVTTEPEVATTSLPPVGITTTTTPPPPPEAKDETGEVKTPEERNSTPPAPQEGNDEFTGFEEIIPIRKKTTKGKGKGKKGAANKKNAHAQQQQQHEAPAAAAAETSSSMDFDLKPKQF